MPRRHSPHPKWTQPCPNILPEKRPILSTNDVKLLAEKMSQQYGWDAPPRNFQLEGVRAQLEGTDMIIQAATGAGKTAIAAGPHTWPTSAGKLTIVISPLLALEEEMVSDQVNQI